MKQYYLSTSIVLSLIMFVFGCGDSKNGGKEPNDVILEASPIQLGKKVSMKIDSNHDRDWYRVVLPGKGYLHVGAKDIPDPINPEIRFAEKQPWQNEKKDWYTSWNDLAKAKQFHDRDTVYFTVQDNNRNNSSPKSFAIKARFIEEFDEHELNNEAGQAVKQTTGKTITSYFYPIGERDWFKFETDSLGYLWVKEKSSPDNIKPEVTFNQRDPMTEEVNKLKGDCQLPCAIRISEKGTYHIRIQDNNRNNSSRDPVKWKVDYLEEMDETEPNGEADQARKITVPDTLSLAVFSLGDNEYFRFTPESDKKILVKGNFPDELDPEMNLYEKQGLDKEQLKNEVELPGQIKLKKGTTYFIQIKDNHHNDSSPKPFKLMFLEGKTS